MPSAAKVTRWNVNNAETTAINVRSRRIVNTSGDASSPSSIDHCSARRNHGTWSVQPLNHVPRRITAHAKVPPFAQPQPPMRILAHAARKYVATAAT